MTLDTLANWLEIIGFVALIVATVNTIWLRSDRARQNAKINIKLSNGGRMYQLPNPIRRKEFSRAEVMGRLGMIPRHGGNQGRYSIAYLNKQDFLDAIEKIYNDNLLEDTLIIPCSDDEFDQFDISKASVQKA